VIAIRPSEPDARAATRRPATADRHDVYMGLMSGTSLDGISAAVVRFHDSARTAYPSGCELLAHLTRPYAPAERQRLERAIQHGATTAQWCQLGFDLGAWLADAAEAVLEASGVPRRSVRAIGSHGQTVWHEPGRSTWQIGEAAVIAERLDIDVVSDFRVQDVAAGGQGAPLVPLADAVLFAPDVGGRALQNLGGIANVTVVPARSATPVPRRASASRSVAGTGVQAFDTGPGVVVIDGVVRALRPELAFDVDGAIARQGAAIPIVVDTLLADAYFAAPPPKSTGRELFSAGYIADFMARCRATKPGATDADIVATAVSLTARSVGDAYRRFVPPAVESVLLSGGGARNPVLVESLVRELAPRVVQPFAEVYFDGEAKEAVAFALLALLHVTGRPGNVPSATGARGPRILGKMTRSGGRSRARGR
jgi:anhydro-N-acetylmuramic acid kinase